MSTDGKNCQTNTFALKPEGDSIATQLVRSYTQNGLCGVPQYAEKNAQSPFMPFWADTGKDIDMIMMTWLVFGEEYGLYLSPLVRAHFDSTQNAPKLFKYRYARHIDFHQMNFRSRETNYNPKGFGIYISDRFKKAYRLVHLNYDQAYGDGYPGRSLVLESNSQFPYIFSVDSDEINYIKVLYNHPLIPGGGLKLKTYEIATRKMSSKPVPISSDSMLTLDDGSLVLLGKADIKKLSSDGTVVRTFIRQNSDRKILYLAFSGSDLQVVEVDSKGDGYLCSGSATLVCSSLQLVDGYRTKNAIIATSSPANYLLQTIVGENADQLIVISEIP